MNRTVVLGILKDKAVDRALDMILPIADYIITVSPNNHRALLAEDLAKKVQERGVKVSVAKDIKDSLDMALRDNNAVLYVGSLYMIGEAREIILRAISNYGKEL